MALWPTATAQRVDVEPLTRDAVAELLDAALGATTTSATVVDPVRQSSAGNVMTLRELCRGSLEAGTLVEQGGLWIVERLGGTSSARLSELVTSRLAHLTDDQVSSLEIVALGEPIGFDEAVRLGARDVDGLKRPASSSPHGPGDGPSCDSRTPASERCFAGGSPSLRGRELRRQLAEGLMRAGARRRGDVLLLATLLLDSDGTGPAEVLRAATRHAYSPTSARWPSGSHVPRRTRDPVGLRRTQPR